MERKQTSEEQGETLSPDLAEPENSVFFSCFSAFLSVAVIMSCYPDQTFKYMGIHIFTNRYEISNDLKMRAAVNYDIEEIMLKTSITIGGIGKGRFSGRRLLLVRPGCNFN